MEPKDDQQPRRRARDLPSLIKIILLVFLILLLVLQFARGEFGQLAEGDVLTWFILLIKLILIAILIWLMRVQRDLKCEITKPKDCVKEQADIAKGELFVEVIGTASGAAFGSYKLEVKKGTDPPIPDIVSYPGGGSSGSAPVVNGVLGRFDTTGLDDGAYTVILTVYPAGAGSPKPCTITFNLLKVMVLMEKVGKIPAVSMAPVPDSPNPLDPNAELRKDFAVAPPPPDYQLVAVGGSMSIDGMAYIYGCAGRKITKYEIRYAQVTTLGGEPAQPSTLSPIPAATWPIGNQIVLVEYTSPDYYKFWNKLGPASTNLIRKWDTFIFGYYLKEQDWHSGGVGSGRFSLLLTAEDSIGATYHDIQHIWLDNNTVFALITGIQNVNPCAELSLNQFVGVGMDILGIAWDRLIDVAFPATAPNDNFDRYLLRLFKQGGGHHDIGTFTNRVIVPFRDSGPNPAPAEAGLLANFGIATVIDAANPSSDPNVSIPRNQGCAYYLRLDVWDNTRLNDDNNVHHDSSIWPFCIVNDLS